MYKKLAIAGTLLVLLTLTVCLSSPALASASTSKAFKCRVVKHYRHADRVKRGDRTLLVRDHHRYVKVDGVRRYRVLKRHDRYVVLRSVAAAPAVSLSGEPQSVGKPAWASSNLSRAVASAANDGRTSTRWAASSKSYPQWWTVDLGAAKNVLGVRTAWYGNKRAYQYVIETSIDGTTFTTSRRPQREPGQGHDRRYARRRGPLRARHDGRREPLGHGRLGQRDHRLHRGDADPTADAGTDAESRPPRRPRPSHRPRRRRSRPRRRPRRRRPRRPRSDPDADGDAHADPDADGRADTVGTEHRLSLGFPRGGRRVHHYHRHRVRLHSGNQQGDLRRARERTGLCTCIEDGLDLVVEQHLDHLHRAGDEPRQGRLPRHLSPGLCDQSAAR